MAENLQTVEEQVAEIYISTFGRAPDQEGLTYWTTQVLNGDLTMEEVNKSFFDQPETQAMYDGVSDEEFLSSVYQNVLGREPDQEGFDYWINEFNEGKHTQDTFIQTMINGAKAETGSPEDAALLNNKVTTGLLYAKEIGQADSPLASQVMRDVTADASSAENSMGTINYYKGWIEQYSDALGTEAGITKEDLYKNIDNADYWDTLEQEHSLNFNAQPNVKFWNVSKDLWTDTASDNQSNTKFDFLNDENAWYSSENFTKFNDGEFANMTNDKLFNLEATQTGNMYGDYLATSGDLSALEGINQEDINGMFSNLDDAKFTEILGNTGKDGLDFFGTNMSSFNTKVNDMDDAEFANLLEQTGTYGTSYFNDRVTKIDAAYFTQTARQTGTDGESSIAASDSSTIGATYNSQIPFTNNDHEEAMYVGNDYQNYSETESTDASLNGISNESNESSYMDIG